MVQFWASGNHGVYFTWKAIENCFVSVVYIEKLPDIDKSCCIAAKTSLNGHNKEVKRHLKSYCSVVPTHVGLARYPFRYLGTLLQLDLVQILTSLRRNWTVNSLGQILTFLGGLWAVTDSGSHWQLCRMAVAS